MFDDIHDQLKCDMSYVMTLNDEGDGYRIHAETHFDEEPSDRAMDHACYGLTRAAFAASPTVGIPSSAGDVVKHLLMMVLEEYSVKAAENAAFTVLAHVGPFLSNQLSADVAQAMLKHVVAGKTDACTH